MANSLRAGNCRRVFHKFLNLEIADADPEVLPRDIFNLVRFVEDHGRVVRQNAPPNGLVAHRQIGKEQVVVDDDDVAFRARRCISVIKQRSNCLHFCPAQDSLRASSFHHVLLLSASSRSSLRSPVSVFCSQSRMMRKSRDFLDAGQHRLPLGVVQLLAAQVVGAPLHVADRKRLIEEALQKRQIFEIELLLQRFCSGRDNHPFARKKAGTR